MSRSLLVDELSALEMQVGVPDLFDTVLLPLVDPLATGIAVSLAGKLGQCLVATAVSADRLEEACVLLAGQGFRYILVINNAGPCPINLGQVQWRMWENEMETSLLFYTGSQHLQDESDGGPESTAEAMQSARLDAATDAMAEDIRTNILCRR